MVWRIEIFSIPLCYRKTTMKTFGIKEQNTMRKAARRNFEIENEVPKFRAKVQGSNKEYRRPKHKKMRFDLED
jgi:hypothetical protein